MFAKLLPREEQYFSLFAQMTSYINDAAKTLVEMMSHRDGDYQEYVQRIKSIEHACDDLTHNVSTRLNQSFITPFDREDIYTLAMALDDVCDYIDASARSIVMYDIHEIDQYARDLALVLQKQAAEVHNAVSLLHLAKGMEQHLLNIQRLENDADDIYFRAMAQLFKGSPDAVKLIKYKELYDMTLPPAVCSRDY